ncbi:hypothetical protein Tco_0705001 [Tanacetum coccineum]|uniref:Uncharacterized protein n=1 Tax=Tanacetum coccineum TaxID=301880 RepID=A0ABQ4Y550_9ASTR
MKDLWKDARLNFSFLNDEQNERYAALRVDSKSIKYRQCIWGPWPKGWSSFLVGLSLYFALFLLEEIQGPHNLLSTKVRLSTGLGLGEEDYENTDLEVKYASQKKIRNLLKQCVIETVCRKGMDYAYYLCVRKNPEIREIEFGSDLFKTPEHMNQQSVSTATREDTLQGSAEPLGIPRHRGNKEAYKKGKDCSREGVQPNFALMALFFYKFNFPLQTLSLDDFVDVTESVCESVVEKPTVETNEPKTARKEKKAPIIEDWVSDSDEENMPKVKTIKMFNKPSFAKINFVKSTEQVKSPRKTSVDKNRHNTPSPRGNKRNWNQQMS